MTGTDHKILLNRLLAGKDLSSGEMEAFIGAIMDGGIDDVVMAAMLVALRAKGETGPEVAAAARAMRARSIPVKVSDPQLSVDTCGTGGDGAETINISTAAALLAAAAGAPVAKHGNRSVSSQGIVGAIIAPVFAAIGALAALVAKFKIEVVRKEE